jgi:hypothetical protein
MPNATQALVGVTARRIQRIAVVGAGTMGSGIAISALDGGFEVLLLDQDPDALARGTGRVLDHYSGRVSSSKLKPEQMAERVGRFVDTTSWERLAEADMVIEAVFEDLSVKQEVFRKIDAIAQPGTLLASNTSYLDLDAIAHSTSRPQDVVGLHFFSPAHVMRLVEVVQASEHSFAPRRPLNRFAPGPTPGGGSTKRRRWQSCTNRFRCCAAFGVCARCRAFRSIVGVAEFFFHSTAVLALLPLVARNLPGGAAGTFTLLLACMGGGALPQ